MERGTVAEEIDSRGLRELARRRGYALDRAPSARRGPNNAGGYRLLESLELCESYLFTRFSVN